MRYRVMDSGEVSKCTMTISFRLLAVMCWRISGKTDELRIDRKVILFYTYLLLGKSSRISQ